MPAPLDALGIGEAALVGTSGESIPGAARVTLTWGRHLPTLEAPATMNPLILNWLRDVAGVTAATCAPLHQTLSRTSRRRLDQPVESRTLHTGNGPPVYPPKTPANGRPEAISPDHSTPAFAQLNAKLDNQ